MCEAYRAASAPRNFTNTWVQHLVLQLPCIAVAIDDSVVALVERCMQHLVIPSQQPLTAQTSVAAPGLHQDAPGLYQSAPGMTHSRLGGNSPGLPSWTPCGSPLNLVQRARQATQLNAALDNFGSGATTGESSDAHAPMSRLLTLTSEGSSVDTKAV